MHPGHAPPLRTSQDALLYADRTSSDRIWPFTIYPKVGTIEVVFQHIRRSPVFSDPALREEFRQRLQTAGISIPEPKLNLQPSYGIDVLRGPAALTAVKSALEWFALVYRTRLTQERQTDLPDLGEVLGLV